MLSLISLGNLAPLLDHILTIKAAQKSNQVKSKRHNSIVQREECQRIFQTFKKITTDTYSLGLAEYSELLFF